MSNKHFIKIWDLPTRIFHWSLVVCVSAAFITGTLGGKISGTLGGSSMIEWHSYFGIAIIGLLAFRITWGVIGSTYSRFTQFVPGPGRVIAYLRGRWHGHGHNPLGAFSVLALLAVLVFQGVTGLFSTDDIAFNGPLYRLISSETSNWLTSLHRKDMWVIGILVTLHIGAIFFYTLFKEEDLIEPMITGLKEVPEDQTNQSAQKGGFGAFVVALVVAGAVVWIANGGLLSPPPPPPPPESLPAW